MSAADPRPEWDRSLDPARTHGTMAADIVAAVRAGGADETTAAYELNGRAIDCYRKRLHAKGRLFFHAAYTLAPTRIASTAFYGDLVTAYGLP